MLSQREAWALLGNDGKFLCGLLGLVTIYSDKRNANSNCKTYNALHTTLKYEVVKVRVTIEVIK